jgi:hypothetical protein
VASRLAGTIPPGSCLIDCLPEEPPPWTSESAGGLRLCLSDLVKRDGRDLRRKPIEVH